MNKKFTTLLAGLVLASSAVSAQTSIDTSIKLKVGPNDGLYQIVSATNPNLAIVLGADDKLSAEDISTPDAANFASTLWCIDVDAYNQGQTPKFDFTNKQYGRILDISKDGEIADAKPGFPSAQLTVGGDVSGWAFSSIYGDGVEVNKPLFSYYKADSVVALKVVGNTIVGVKMGANQVATETGDPSFKFSLKKPARITLNAKALNTLLGTKDKGTSFKMTFKETAVPNVMANELVARDTLGTTMSDGYVLLTNKQTGKYLRVDTAYNNTTGVKFIVLSDTTTAVAYEDAVTSTAFAALGTANYAFHFEYDPATDKVYVQVKGAVPEKNGDYWNKSNVETDPAKLYIYVQDLKAASVLTVGKTESNITLGFGTCTAVATTKTTIPNDLYVIKSEDGKYLAVPIHGEGKMQWVTLEKNVNVWTMPSFQWVVEKLNTSDYAPIKITNREYADQTISSIQLDKETAASLPANGVSKGVMPAGFIAATAEVKADSLLGYKYLDKEDLLVTRYKFRYLHEFSDNYFVGVNSDVNDSILYVGGKSPFKLTINDKLTQYGYSSKNVAGLKPLYRQSYTLKIQNAKLIFGAKAENVAVDAEGRFAISEYFDGVKTIADGSIIDPCVFYIKANNEKAINEQETLFYAFVNRDLADATKDTKVGTDDNNLWLKDQQMKESRTSAFSVEVDESPLYRRFNTEKEGVVANDDPDTLKFFRVNNPADMLFEDAHSVYSEDKEINFLGVNNNIQFPDAKRAIYADTAYVNRGTGYIKPQYLLGVDVRTIQGSDSIPCPLDHNHGFDKDGNALDKWTCSHATPGTTGYVRARYLVNTVDSAKVAGNYMGADRDKDYIWNNQVRLAFVEAIHKADTLYILRGDTANWADPVDFAKLPNKIRLDNNEHKNVVFSFRLLEEGSDNFLMESAETDGEMIAPMKGGWVKIQNGVPVVSYAAFKDAANEAEIFNVEKTSETPTENESLSTSEVSIQTIAGAVIVKNAAGKSVKVTNILGQPLAETVLTSDNATVGVPAGIVVVAVEGEDAVKTVVK